MLWGVIHTEEHQYFSRLVLLFILYLLVPFLLIFLIHRLDSFVEEIARAKEYSPRAILFMVTAYYVTGILNVVFFTKTRKLWSYLFWIIGLVFVGSGIILYCFYESFGAVGWIVFSWDYSLAFMLPLLSCLYSLIFLVIVISNYTPTKAKASE
ncbi:hypothetical protein D3C74_303270 [compost metagenome]